MAQRISQKMLDELAAHINYRLGYEAKLGYSRDGLVVDAAYGGYRIEGSGGSRDLSQRGTAREVYNWLDGFAAALDELDRPRKR